MISPMYTNLKLSTAIVVSAVALVGCGSSSDDTATAPAAAVTTPSAASTPEGIWAGKLCSALAGKVKPVTPPQVDSASVKDAQASLVSFVTSLQTGLTDQITTLKTVGAPPVDAAAADYESAIKQVRSVRRTVAGVGDDLSKKTLKTKKQLDAELADFGAKLKVLGTYSGPVAELVKSASLKDAITSQPACATLSS